MESLSEQELSAIAGGIVQARDIATEALHRAKDTTAEAVEGVSGAVGSGESGGSGGGTGERIVSALQESLGWVNEMASETYDQTKEKAGQAYETASGVMKSSMPGSAGQVMSKTQEQAKGMAQQASSAMQSGMGYVQEKTLGGDATTTSGGGGKDKTETMATQSPSWPSGVERADPEVSKKGCSGSRMMT